MIKLAAILFVSLTLTSGAFSAETAVGTNSSNNTITFKKPPEVLADWYKPGNKRQVWLHTMFRLRREILAMNDYAEKGQQAELEKWTNKFIKDYQSIAKMVPDWEEYLDRDKLALLEKSVQDGQYSSVSPIIKKIGKSCMKCHDDYQTITTLMYRTPDFNQQIVKTGKTQQDTDYDVIMGQLSDAVNRVNIAIKDGYFSNAHEFLSPLEQQLSDLSAGCSDCHKNDEVPVERIMGASKALLPELAEQLKLQDKKQAGRKLGEFAVKVCARCHAVHRLTSDLKNELE